MAPLQRDRSRTRQQARRHCSERARRVRCLKNCRGPTHRCVQPWHHCRETRQNQAANQETEFRESSMCEAPQKLAWPYTPLCTTVAPLQRPALHQTAGQEMENRQAQRVLASPNCSTFFNPKTAVSLPVHSVQPFWHTILPQLQTATSSPQERNRQYA